MLKRKNVHIVFFNFVALLWTFLATASFAQQAQPSDLRENSELAAFTRQSEGLATGDLLKLLDETVERLPDNRRLRLRRAAILMDVGRIPDAAKDLKRLSESDLNYPSLRDKCIQLARIAGNNRDELLAWQEWARVPVDPNQAAVQVAAKVIEANIAELKGDFIGAEASWKEYLKNKAIGDGYHRSLGDFYLRRGRWTPAVEEYSKVIDNNLRRDNFVWATAFSRASVYWIDSKKGEAEREFSQLVRDLGVQDQSKAARDLRILSTLALWSLRQMETAPPLPQRGTLSAEEVDVEMKKLERDLEKEPFRSDIVLAIFVNKLDATKGLKEVSRILGDAPYLDWAVWSNFYLAIKFPGERERILKELREDTIAHKLLATYMSQARGRR